MTIVVVGLSHHGASLEKREKVAFTPGELVPALAGLRERGSAREAVMLSTCNRTEIYLVAGEGDPAEAAWELLARRLGEDARPFGYAWRDEEAVAHLFRVAAGLDSMILGEAQIQGQVRDAWERSRAHAGVVLNRLFQTALLVAGRVRSETAIGRGAASVSSASVQLAKQIFGSIGGLRAMVLGAGEMAELALECFASEGVLASIVANRTYDRAVELPRRARHRLRRPLLALAR
ncbi:MAG: glutamyl-tRNA reductase [Gemmatimonadaceae bacterium]